ncbi:hypothetical protein NPN18_24180, partial [Vibrio parahaemolyticus]|nr:hypothetical protein [Vibrio parahaemolyticus]
QYLGHEDEQELEELHDSARCIATTGMDVAIPSHLLLVDLVARRHRGDRGSVEGDGGLGK